MKDRYTTLPHDGRIQVWDVEQLWQRAKGLPVQLVPVTSITDYDTVCWYGTPANWGRLTCGEVVEHIQRIIAVMFDAPILLSLNRSASEGAERSANCVPASIAVGVAHCRKQTPSWSGFVADLVTASRAV